MTKIRLGIVGTGRIAKRFVPEARMVEGIEIAAVCNPREESAAKFAQELGIPGYTTMIMRMIDCVDAVYIATPHETHYMYAKAALSRGVHVLCEKPMVFSKAQAEELFAIAKEKNCVLMEGIKTAYCPGFQGLLAVVRSGAIGKVFDVEACFSRLSATNVREMTDTQYGGSFLEFGTYTMLPIVKLLGTGEKEVRYRSALSGNGLDIYTKTEFAYEEETGLSKTGLMVKSEGELVIAGNRGYILVQAPWWLTKHFEVRHEDPNRREVYDFPYEGQGLRYEVQAFVKRIRGEEAEGVEPAESVWLAEKMESFLKQRAEKHAEPVGTDKADVKIWAHRGCSLAYPENTLEAFAAAAAIPGLTGIELDIQLTKDGEIVVIHDETVNRTTNGTGKVCDHTLAELKRLQIVSRDGATTEIPTLAEVFEELSEICHKEREEGPFLINIELKNSVIRYEGMEEKVLKLVEQYDLERNIVYSSFLPESMGLIKKLKTDAQTGILGGSMQNCYEQALVMQADAVHPWIGGLDMTVQDVAALKGMPVRAWNMEEPFFGQDRVLRERNLEKYAAFGVTEVITNVPEWYLEGRQE